MRELAERRFTQDRKYIFCGQDLARVQDERERERRREQYITVIENEILRRHPEPTGTPTR